MTSTWKGFFFIPITLEKKKNKRLAYPFREKLRCLIVTVSTYRLSISMVLLNIFSSCNEIWRWAYEKRTSNYTDTPNVMMRRSVFMKLIFSDFENPSENNFAPAANASERGGILALPHARDAGIFSKLIVFFFSQEIFLTQLNT